MNSRSGSLATPLMVAAGQAGQAATVSLLLQRGAEVNLRNIHGNTALHYANSINRNIEGNTALNFAFGNRYNNVIPILRNNGGV